LLAHQVNREGKGKCSQSALGTLAVKACGYKFVALDLADFKSGSLHVATK